MLYMLSGLDLSEFGLWTSAEKKGLGEALARDSKESAIFQFPLSDDLPFF